MKEQKNELVKLEDVSNEIDTIVTDCIPFANSELTTFSATLSLATGVKRLREIFLTNPDIKDVIMAMKDTRLGFLTDRSKKAIAAAKEKKKELTPYDYEEVVECCIEAMLKGYRITNNEWNIIAGGFYAAKAGKYRKIVEYPAITDFQHTETSPQFEGEKYAKVKVYASWKKDGVRMTLGNSDPEKGIEDTQVYKIRVNAYMGEDAIIGKAQSKLFTRVLERIQGKSMPECSDVEFTGDVIDVNALNGTKSLTPDKQKEAKEGEDIYGQKKEGDETIIGDLQHEDDIQNQLEGAQELFPDLYNKALEEFPGHGLVDKINQLASINKAVDAGNKK